MSQQYIYLIWSNSAKFETILSMQSQLFNWQPLLGNGITYLNSQRRLNYRDGCQVTAECEDENGQSEQWLT